MFLNPGVLRFGHEGLDFYSALSLDKAKFDSALSLQDKAKFGFALRS